MFTDPRLMFTDPRQTFVDVGAYVGDTVLRFAQLVGKSFRKTHDALLGTRKALG